jgi:hypothetical protein
MRKPIPSLYSEQFFAIPKIRFSEIRYVVSWP